MRLKDWFLLLVLSVIWGSSFLFIKLGLRELSPFFLVFFRIALGAGFLLVLCRLKGLPLPDSRQNLLSLAFLGIINCGIPFLLVAWAELHIDSGTASILNATSPVFVMVLAHFFTDDEKLTPARCVGVLTGIAGIVVMMWPGLKEGIRLAGLGQLAMLGATFSYSVSGIFAKRFNGQPPLMVTAISLTGASIVFLPALFYLPQPDYSALQLQTVLSVAFLGILGTGLAFVAYYRVLATAGATNVLLVTLLIPISALFLSHFLLHETIRPSDLGGMLLIFTGLLVIDGRVTRALRTRIFCGKSST